MERAFTLARTRYAWLLTLRRDLDSSADVGATPRDSQDISAEIRQSITRTAMLLTLFSKHCIPVSAELVVEAHDTALRIAGDGQQGLRKLARPEVGVEILRALALGREE